MNVRQLALLLIPPLCWKTASSASSPAASVDNMLAANYQSTGGRAWDTKSALELDYKYSEPGLTGTVSFLQDLRGGGFVDRVSIGPQPGETGFDGAHAWERQPAGTVTQEGGDTLAQAVNESYRNLNLWWHSDRGGAQVDARGVRSDPTTGASYAVLSVTPRGGKPFEAWFNRRTHLLERTIQVQGAETITRMFSEYRPVEGVQLAQKIVIDSGIGPDRQTETLTLLRARFLPAQPPSVFAMPHVVLHDFLMAGAAHEVSVPFELVNNHIYAQVSVNGAPPHLWIFDTGGRDALLMREAARPAPSFSSRKDSEGDAGLVPGGSAKMRSISVGGATLSDQVVPVLPLPPEDVEGVDAAGMVGYEFFARFITQIDYGAHRIHFIDKHYFDPKSAGTPVPFLFLDTTPAVRGSYNGIPANFGIDTGARTALLLTGPFVEAHRLRAHAAAGIEALVGWNDGPVYGFVEHGGMLKLGDVSVSRPLTVLLDEGAAGGVALNSFNNIGGGVLKRFIVTLDYARYIIYLKPITAPIADLDTFDESGLWINGTAQGFHITSVAPHSPAQEAGLLAGDMIIAVNGTPFSAIKLYELRRWLRNDPPGTAVTFTVRHQKDAPRTVRLRLRNLF